MLPWTIVVGSLELILIFSFMINTQDLTFSINESKNDTANLASCCAWVACLEWCANRGGETRAGDITSNFGIAATVSS